MRRRRRKRKRRQIRMFLAIIIALFCGYFLGLTVKGNANKKEEASVCDGITRDEDYKSMSTEMLVNEETSANVSEHSISIKGLSQAGIPTGCEAVCATAVLNYYEVDIGVNNFINSYLDCEPYTIKGDKYYATSPNEAFIGSPYEKSAYGCFAPVITNAVNKLNKSDIAKANSIHAFDATGTELNELCQKFVANDNPVCIWVTMYMKPSYDSTIFQLEDGTIYTWKAREHCMVLCGFDEENYYLMDPLSSGNIVKYEKELVEARYEEMAKNAVVIYKKYY